MYSRNLLLVGGDQAAEPGVEFAWRLGFNLRSEASLIGASGDAAILVENFEGDGFVVAGEVMQFEIRVNLPEFFFDALLQDLEVAHLRSWKGSMRKQRFWSERNSGLCSVMDNCTHRQSWRQSGISNYPPARQMLIYFLPRASFRAD
jgi:hypothetical protein